MFVQWYAEIRDKYFTLKPLILIATKSDQVKSQTRYDPNFVRHQECLDFAQRVDAAKFIDVRAPSPIVSFDASFVPGVPVTAAWLTVFSRAHRRTLCSARHSKRLRSSALRRCPSSRAISV